MKYAAKHTGAVIKSNPKINPSKYAGNSMITSGFVNRIIYRTKRITRFIDSTMIVFNLRPFRFNPNFTIPNLGFVIIFFAVKKKSNPIPINVSVTKKSKGLGNTGLRLIPIPIPRTNIPK
ncbi:MAG: hypothetical protein ACFFG0_51910 [Candidatus Thorarchaeota archaeon]